MVIGARMRRTKTRMARNIATMGIAYYATGMINVMYLWPIMITMATIYPPAADVYRFDNGNADWLFNHDNFVGRIADSRLTV
jgi:hypothetical protein